MTDIKYLIRRNIKLFFKDKGLFFTSLITPLILLVLYITFLANVYKESFLSGMPQSLEIPEKLINGLVGGQLIGSLLAVCCVTVAFCSNMLMVQDKINGVKTDLKITPVKPSTLALSYYIATFISTLIICIVAATVGLIYIATIGWYISALDILSLFLTMIIMILFSTAFSSIVNFFLTSQGQISAVGSLISSVYGFICGAYMPISSFSQGLQKVIMFLPGTYGTSLIKNCTLNGVFREMENLSFPNEIINSVRKTIDCDLLFFDNKVSISTMFIIISVTALSLIAIYVLMNSFSKKEK